MTKPEAEILTHRLARVWAPDRSYYWDTDWTVKGHFYFKTTIEGDIHFMCHDTPNDLPHERQLEMGHLRQETWFVGLVYRPGTGITALPQRSTPAAALAKPFSDQWLDFFRRGCWLCGYDIDATAHEKSEWMQGFTRDELKAWNLKF